MSLASPSTEVRDLRRENDRLRLRVAELEERVSRLSGSDEADKARTVLGLSLNEARLFGIILRRGAADYGLLDDALYSYDSEGEGGPGRPHEAVRSVIKRMRRKIRPLGLDVTTEYSFGYTMTEAMRARARRILESGK